MKKFLNIILACVLFATMCILPSADSSDEELSVSDLIVTAYSSRTELDDESLAELETAYAEISAASSVSDLVSGLPSGLVSLHLFNVTIEGTTGEFIESGGTITVTMEVYTPNSDIYVLARIDGEWVIINSSVESVDGNNVSVLVELIDTDCPLLVAARETDESTDGSEDESSDGMKETDTEEDTIAVTPDSGEGETASSVSVTYIVLGIGCVVVAVIILLVLVTSKKKK